MTAWNLAFHRMAGCFPSFMNNYHSEFCAITNFRIICYFLMEKNTIIAEINVYGYGNITEL